MNRLLHILFIAVLVIVSGSKVSASDSTGVSYAEICVSNIISDAEKLIEKKQYRKAADKAKECEQYLEQDVRPVYIAQYYQLLSTAYEKLGLYKLADSCYVLYSAYQQNIFDEGVMQELTIIKKQQTDAVQNAIQEKEMQKMNMEHAMEQRRLRMWMITVLTGLLLMAVLAGFIIKLIRIKRKANNLLTSANHELADQREKIKLQCDLITQSRDEIEDANNQIIRSIQYAERIQQAVIASAGNFSALFRDSFVYYRPKNIVSGDFYFAGKCGRLSVFVVADCTGHGIPGGFLSMLGISAVKEFLNDEETALHPGLVLDKLKSFVKTTFNTKTEVSSMEDGMDMSICSFDFENRMMYYATANQSIIIVRNGKPEKLKGNSMPVGKYYLEAGEFSSLSYKLEYKDMVYLFTDGFQDQLGGDLSLPVGRKLYSKILIEFLCQHYQFPVQEQCQQLDTFINEWRNGRDLTDDMTLAAIRVV